MDRMESNLIYEEFSKNLQQYSNKIAISDLYDNKLNYFELGIATNKLSDFFVNLGLKSGDHILIESEKIIYALIAITSCWKMNISYTFLPQSLPGNRITEIKQISKANFAIRITKEVFFNLDDFTSNIPLIYKVDNLTDLNTENTESRQKGQIAYVMFTSGSTGKPKGVPIEYQQVFKFFKWLSNDLQINFSDKITNLNPLYFDNSVFDVYLALLSGAELILVDTDENSLDWIGKLDAKNPTIWFSVPSLLCNLQNYKVLDGNRFSSVSKFIFGGEAFPKRTLELIFRTYSKNAKFISVYGPTESTCICSYHEIDGTDFLNEELFVTLGKFAPFFNISLFNIHSVNSELQGELCLSGSNVSSGYLDSALDKDKFYKLEDSNLYRTGDLVKFSKNDNKVYFLGRIDNQIKKMGIRIELEEIESKIEEFDLVERSICFFHSEKNAIVCNYESSPNIDTSKLELFIQSNLPKYMCPNILIRVDKVPLNRNGKKDRVTALTNYLDGLNL